MRQFRIASVIAVIVGGILAALVSLAIWVNYHDSVALLQHGGLDRLFGDQALVLYPAPRTIIVGMPFDPGIEAERLKDLGYRSSNTEEPGTFHVEPGRISIVARFNELDSVRVVVSAGRVSQLCQLHGDTLSAAHVEVPPLETLEVGDTGIYHPVLYAWRPWSSYRGTALADAVIEREDPEFWSQADIPIRGLLRGLWNAGGSGGGSGLLQQEVKNFVLRDSRRSYLRKWRELGIAEAIASTVRDRTLLVAAYLNAAPLGGSVGRPVRGYTAGARAYFGVAEVSDLTLAQATTLAVITSRPSGYLAALRSENPADAESKDYPSRWRSLVPAWLTHRFATRTIDTPAVLLARLKTQRDQLIDRLGRRYPQRYSPSAVAIAKATPLALGAPYRAPKTNEEAGQFLDFVLSRGMPSRTGRIYTTLDQDLQHEAVMAVQQQTLAMKRWLKLSAAAPYESAFIALSPTGEIIAMVGGATSARGNFNRATDARRSGGSIFKPLVYGLGFELATNPPMNLLTMINGEHDPTADGWRATRHCGGTATIYEHLATSTNCPPAVVAARVGLDSVRAMFRENLHVQPEYSSQIVIGSGHTETSPLHIAEAYAAVSNRGLYTEARALSSAWVNGGQLPVIAPNSHRMFRPETAFLIQRLMTAPLRPGGTAAAARTQMDLPAGMDAFAKTGTGMRSDASFVLLFPKIVMLAWSGMDNNEELPMADGFQGATAAEPIVTHIVRNMWRRRPDLFPVARVTVPAGLVRRPVNRKAGCVSPESEDLEYFAPDGLPPDCAEVDTSVAHESLPTPLKKTRRSGAKSRPVRPTVHREATAKRAYRHSR
jgi:membrane peptidoglycan carboxypeptidase